MSSDKAMDRLTDRLSTLRALPQAVPTDLKLDTGTVVVDIVHECDLSQAGIDAYQLRKKAVWHRRVAATAFAVLLYVLLLRLNTVWTMLGPGDVEEIWFGSINNATELCTGIDGKGASYAGYIGLKGDTTDTPKRSFYWLFEAQNDSENAPVILTVGGGPGTSGILNPMIGQSHCRMTENGTVPNENAWSEHFNLLALDHPIGVGYSYGSMVNNSRDAAVDVYDFLQKFFKLYPQLAKNQFVVASGSYGGVYVPHIATVIHMENAAVDAGHGQPGAIHINLESLMISNPLSDYLSYQWWALHHRCYTSHIFNETACAALFDHLPECLDATQAALQHSTVESRTHAMELCDLTAQNETVDGKVLENYKQKCNGTFEECYPVFPRLNAFLNANETRGVLGIPDGVKYEGLSWEVNGEFRKYGDMVQQSNLLYEPLLSSGIRVLHYIGKLDSNCPWPGTFAFLTRLRTPFQTAFNAASDVPWPSEDIATTRVVGSGAGNMTMVLMAEAGHFVVQDQPKLVKSIVEHWVWNEEFA